MIVCDVEREGSRRRRRMWRRGKRSSGKRKRRVTNRKRKPKMGGSECVDGRKEEDGWERRMGERKTEWLEVMKEEKKGPKD